MAAPRPTLDRESAVWANGQLLVGVDEAGRGPLAGPVVAAAVVFPAGSALLEGVRDSKTLSAARREALALVIRGAALAVGVAGASVREIDGLNIRVATALAMRRAIVQVLTRVPASPLLPYFKIFVTTPAPTVRPPSRIAKRRPSSMAIGVISSTLTPMLSPGMTISTPAGSSTEPVTSVVRK